MVTNATQGHNAGQSTVNYSLTDFTDETIQPDFSPWDTSDPLMSATTRILMQQVLKCYIRQPVVFVGVLGNVLCCAVFLKQGLSDRINLLLFWLSVADLSSLVGQALSLPDCYLADPLSTANWGVVLTAYVGPISWWLTFASGMLTLCLSVDRCLTVVLPFKAGRFLTYRLTVAFILVSYLLPLIFTLFNFLAYVIKWRTDSVTNRSSAYMHPTVWFPFDHRLAMTLKAYFSLVIRPVCLVCMIVSSAITVLHLRRASQSRVTLGGNVTEDAKSEDKRITVMLLIICGAYIVFSLPQIAYSMTLMVVPEYNVYRRYHNSSVVHYYIIWAASSFNSAINFVPYVMLSSRFRKTLRDMCFCFGSKKQNNM